MAKFISAKFTGSTRFENHKLPAEVLPDLFQYTELVHKLALHLYRHYNNRTTVPKEVKEKLKLSMNAVRDGSAIADFVDEAPVNVIAQPPTEPGTYSEFDILNIARDMINSIMENPNPDALPPEFPPQYLNYFAKFGKSMAVGESILFDQTGEYGTDSRVIRFDTTVRNQLIVNRTPYQESFVFTGKVENISNSKDLITFENFSDNLFYITNLPKAFEEDFRDAHHFHKEREIRCFCLATFAPDGSITRINKLQHAIIHTSDGIKMIPDFNSKLTELKSLRAGWAEGEGRAYTTEEIDKALGLARALTSTLTVPSPYIYPDPDGFISFQWDLGHWNVTCDLLFDSNNIQMHAMNMNTNEVRRIEILSIELSALGIIRFISEFTTIEVSDV